MGIIRLILAISVLITHSSPLFGLKIIDGEIAVQLFFIISGFYMAMVLSEKYTPEKDKLFWLNFYKSRFLRLYPTFVFVSVLFWLYFGILTLYFGKIPANGFVEIYQRMPLWGDIFSIFSNLTMIGQDIPSLFHITSDGVMNLFYSRANQTTEDGAIWVGQVRTIGQAWSIGTEIWFYLLAPTLIGRSIISIIGIALISLSLKIFMETYLNYQSYYFFPAQVFFFLIGVLGYKLGKAKEDSLPIKKVGFIALTLFSFSCLFINAVNQKYYGEYQVFLFVILGFSIYPIFRLTEYSKADRYIGELSYPFYMSHMLIISVTNNILHHLFKSQLVPSWIFLLLILIASNLIYFYIEKPVSQFRKQFAK